MTGACASSLEQTEGYRSARKLPIIHDHSSRAFKVAAPYFIDGKLFEFQIIFPSPVI